MHPGESQMKCSNLRKWLRIFRDSALELVMCVEKRIAMWRVTELMKLRIRQDAGH